MRVEIKYKLEGLNDVMEDSFDPPDKFLCVFDNTYKDCFKSDWLLIVSAFTNVVCDYLRKKYRYNADIYILGMNLKDDTM